jgi:hypothetical protein
MALEAAVMADEEKCCARFGAFPRQQLDEGRLGRLIERRGRLVRQDQVRLADQRARGGDPLLLPDTELMGLLRCQRRIGQTQFVKQTSAVPAGSSPVRTRAATLRERAGQKDVLERAQPWERG